MKATCEDATARRTPTRAGPILLAGTSAGATVMHVGTMLVAGVLTPESHPLSHAMSELGMAGKPFAAFAAGGGMIAPGLLAALSARMVTRLFSVPAPASLGLGAMVMAGTSLVVAGLVPFPAAIHLGAAILAATSCALALALFSPWVAGYLGNSAWKAAGFACSILLTLDAAVWVFAETLHHPPHGLMGLEQRAASFAAFVWWGTCGIALARRAFRHDDRRTGSEPSVNRIDGARA